MELTGNPGPCEYSPRMGIKNHSVTDSIGGGSFSKADRKNIADAACATPGPGEYMLPAKFNDV
jgi:hypothetical protein